MNDENEIARGRNVLVVLGGERGGELEGVIEGFCGEVVYSAEEVAGHAPCHVYACGDLSRWSGSLEGVRVIRELTEGGDELLGGGEAVVVGVGQVPLLVHGVGVLFPRFFEEEDLFGRVQAEHTFQHLTESTKQSKALRTGIYLTDVRREVEEGGREALHFRLLRCSSNLTGPTDNLRATDRMILGALGEAASEVFARETSLNHVLAQVYENTREDGGRGRERKAKISAHSDKTKDMREDGLIAFCTFYDPEGFGRLERSDADRFDWRYKKSSGLTRLYFKLKPGVDDPELAREFSVTLYPNSVFIIPLSTNRLYTHAIKPSPLNVDRIPTRLGYVVRCSSAEAKFVGGQTFLKRGGESIPLEPMTRETLEGLRGSYRQENKTADEVAYGEVHFSMNAGDYERPIL